MDVRTHGCKRKFLFLGLGGGLLPPIKKLTRSTTDPTTPNCLPSTMDEEELLPNNPFAFPWCSYSYISPPSSPSASRVLYTFPILFWNTYKYMWHVHTTWIASHAINLACDRSATDSTMCDRFFSNARTDGSRITTTPPSRADGNKVASPRKCNNDPLLGREVKILFDNFLRSSALCMESLHCAPCRRAERNEQSVKCVRAHSA
jgi:hypothetical protein